MGVTDGLASVSGFIFGDRILEGWDLEKEGVWSGINKKRGWITFMWRRVSVLGAIF